MTSIEPTTAGKELLAASQIDLSAWAASGRRVAAQMMTAIINEHLLPEGMVSVQAAHEREAEIILDVMPGSLQYRARAHIALAYDRLLVLEGSIRRLSNGEERTCDHPVRLVADILPTLPGTPETHARFMEEILQTWSNHAQALCFGTANRNSLAVLPYEEAESALTDGHRHHPCFKSRMGFTPTENLSFGPEFGHAVRPIWLAGHEELTTSRAIGKGHGQDRRLLVASIDETSRKDFAAGLASVVGDPENYHWLPVHPWQWERILAASTVASREARRIVLLGETRRQYLAQQSIRTLSDISDRGAPSLKLSLSICNTSTVRTLAAHTVLNAPIISAWLQEVASSDPFLTTSGTSFLLERMGSTVAVPRDDDPFGRLAGAFAAIWRDPIGIYLDDDKEKAVPFSLLTHLDHDGRPAIAGWISRHGAEAWTVALLHAAMLPVVHLLLARGIAVESHQQNMILVHQDGWPARVALKDFHDGVRFIPGKLHAPRPGLVPTPTEHARINPNSYVEASDSEDVRDFMFDALFGVNLAELAWFLDRHFDLAEGHFWSLAVDILSRYLEENDIARAGVTNFRFLDPVVAVEDLARRRLETGAVPGRQVPNPLTAARGADKMWVPS